MTVGELVELLSRLDPSTEVHVSSGRGSCHVETISKRGRWRERAGDAPLAHNPSRSVTLSGRRLWYEQPPRVALWGKWPRKALPWEKRIERLERERVLRVLAGGER